MRIPRIFQDGKFSTGISIELDSLAFQHVIKVLRLKSKDPLIVFDGKGNIFGAVITELGKKSCWVQLTSHEFFPLPTFKLILAQAIIKPEKMDLIIQKAVELGATIIVPIISQNCDIKLNQAFFDKKFQHWQKIIIGAAEQCGVNHLPELSAVISIKDWVKKVEASQKIVLDPNAQKGFADLDKKSKSLAILVGPEGGLTEEELKLSLQYNFSAIQLGNRILRAETATIASLALAQFFYKF